MNLVYKKIVKRPKKTRKGFASIIGVVALLFVMGIFGKGVPFLSTAFVKEMDNNKETQFINNQNNNGNKQDKSTDENKDNKDNKDDKNNSDKKYSSVVVMGDSLTVDIGEKFKELYPGAVIDGKIGRQLYMAVDEAKNYAQYNNENSAIIFQLGTNGPFTESQLDELVKIFDKADIYFVNVKVPRAWEKTVNSELTKAKEKYSNISIIDWYSVANGNTTLFEPDKVHLKPNGAERMIDLIVKNLKRPVEVKERMTQ